MQQLELRAYTRDEISAITGIPLVYASGKSNSNFIGRVQERLKNWHYECETPHGGAVIITKQPTTALDRLHEIMMRKLDFDKQVSPREFAAFMHFMMTVPNAMCMPVEERLSIINQRYKPVCLSKSTLERWVNSLEECEAMLTDGTVRWKTAKVDDRLSRTLPDGGETAREERHAYTTRMHELFDEFRRTTDLTGKALSKAVFAKLWAELGYGYSRPSPNLKWNGINMGPEIYEEIFLLVCEICKG